MHITAILLAQLGAWIVYLIGLVIYRLFFHPFAKYPGPFLAKISYFHALYHAWLQDTPVEQLRCHRKYGHVVRYGPNTIMFDQPAARNEILGAGKNFTKGKSYVVVNKTPEAPPNISVQFDNKKHAQRKRIITQAFSERALRQSQGYAKVHIDVLGDVISDLPKEYDGKWTKPQNFHRLLYWMIQDVMTDMTFGRSYNMLTKPENRGIGDIMLSSLSRDHLAFQYPGLFKPGMDKWLDIGTWLMPESFGAIMGYLDNGIKSTMERLENPPEDADKRKDILSYLINARDPETGEGIDKNDIASEACILHLGGATTITGCLSLVFFYLSRPHNAHVYRKLANELRTKFSSSDDITLEELEKCVYLNATTFEATRLTSGHAFWRDARSGGAVITVPEHDAEDIIPSLSAKESMQAYFVPDGCTAGFCDFSSCRNSTLYPDADTFDPDRWIPTSDFYTSRGFDSNDGHKIYERARNATRPFGVGQRACIAEQFAKSLMLLAIGNLVYRFDVRKADGPAGELGGGGTGKGIGREKRDEFQWYGSFTLAGDGPMVQFKQV